MYLVLDIGGTKMRLGFSPDGEKLEEPHIIPTPTDFGQALNIIKHQGLILAEGREIKAVALGIAGILDQEKTKLYHAPNLSSWEKQPLKEKLSELFHTQIFLENDAALAGLGEAHKGAGVGRKILAYLTISTGVGGARIVDGQIDTRHLGFEPGHQIINFYEQKMRDLESYVSGPAIKRIYAQEPEHIYNPLVWEEVAQRLAIGLHNLILFWSPEIVILGGSIMKSIDLEDIRAHLQKTVSEVIPEIPEIKKAQLGDLSGLYGGLIYLQQQLSNKS